MSSKGDQDVLGNEGITCTESPRPAQADTRQWIETRYGPVKFASHSVMYGAPGACLVTVVTAAVPLYKGGVAVGAGASEDYAVMALYRDLHRHPPPPLI